MSKSIHTIAVVDDEEAVRKGLGRLLRAAGFAVETFASGHEFLKSLASRRPAAAVLDLHLGEMSGLEVQEELARESQAVPHIVVTGKDEPGLGERVLANGAAAYLLKPVDQQGLLGAIALVLGEPSSNEDSANFLAAHTDLISTNNP